jgi:hypothetical protein
MKTYLTSLLGIVAMSCIVGTAASCSDHQKTQNPDGKSAEVNSVPTVTPERALPPTTVAVTPVATTPMDPFSDASNALTSASRDHTAALTPVPENVSRMIDSGLATWKAKGGVSTNKSESKLALARTDFTQKVNALTLADAATWKSAKADALASLENLRRAYNDLMTGKDEA